MLEPEQLLSEPAPKPAMNATDKYRMNEFASMGFDEEQSVTLATARDYKCGGYLADVHRTRKWLAAGASIEQAYRLAA